MYTKDKMDMSFSVRKNRGNLYMWGYWALRTYKDSEPEKEPKTLVLVNKYVGIASQYY